MIEGNWTDWYPLDDPNEIALGYAFNGGVYIICRKETLTTPGPLTVLRIGEGDVENRLNVHKNDKEILSYGPLSTLTVAWMPEDDEDTRKGIEKYLADKLKPLLGRYPDVEPIPVTLPPGL